MEIKEASLFHEFKGDIQGKVECSKKLYKDAKSFYKTVDESLSDDTIMYEVSVVNSDYKTEGHLNWGISLLHPVLVNGECNMTRGHFHEDLNCEEYYWCASGSGLLMLMDENGKTWCEQMKEGSLHRIDGAHAHRLINTSNEDLKVICVWNANAGHDYSRVEQHPFQYRLFKRNDEICVEEI
ncbi:glucose-6-phosphate isomerase family protein [Floccifex sp.]|uniref:glucose-6-phosphate isomerase family protein n=1 Tax=Floccifex sp. TaxID=2815810 RepID=UPI002A7631C7|nr:glucose-6-phosphate isomerase family protein [Floccifex sp.]MDD7281329.1 glucose-6-phosphate isomerase family protein [Erysipelotrichaceae bacterium]MDY2958914.1 glucose-6-phosphate isomerase family protein [Floccifex sp.]